MLAVLLLPHPVVATAAVPSGGLQRENCWLRPRKDVSSFSGPAVLQWKHGMMAPKVVSTSLISAGRKKRRRRTAISLL